MFLEDDIIHVLWNTGANVSLIDQRNLLNWLPEIQIKDIGILFGGLEGFQVRWGNQNKIVFIGLDELKASLMAEPNTELPVPFLVTPGSIKHFILDANVVYNKGFFQNYFNNCF